MGVVFRARDGERGGEVALKLLKTVDAAGIYRFKQEFRALADVVHPNLVPLYELVASGDQWFFTMELVEGVDFLSYVRGPGADGDDADEDSTQTMTAGGAVSLETAVTSDSAPVFAGVKPPKQALCKPEQFQRLRDALGQLAAGVRALHRAGQLHRDIKPSNVMVTDTGRLVILDFGIATAVESERRSDRTRRIVGTPAYMAPEQSIGAPLTEASDWYAVGTMLYEALTGRRPFDGAPEAVLSMKRQRDPLPVIKMCPDAPPDLVGLCTDLLSRVPEQRPNDEAMATYTAPTDGDGTATMDSLPVPITGETLLLGREPELAALHAAFLQVAAGRRATVLVHGASGMGKSSLVDHFLHRLEAENEAIVLRGRCFERESVPYKAVDSLLDSLAQYLRRLPRDAAWKLMPDNVRSLARLFPVLRQVEAVLANSAIGSDSADPHEQRRNAFRALRQLLQSIARTRPLVVSVDDLQWGDLDSAALLEDVLRPPGAPSMLFIAAYRTEEAASSALLRELLPHHPDAIEVELEPLSHQNSRELALALWPDTSHADTIARESGGSPFFVQELVSYMRDAETSLHDVQLGEVVLARLDTLPDATRNLLSVVAVAGLPLEQGIALRAAGVTRTDRTHVTVLRAGKLVRTGGTRDRDPIESYHDRIRETVVASLPDELLRDIHGRLAYSLEAAGSSDAEAIAVHYAGAGENARAARFYEVAAANATATLALDRAVALYGRAIELHAGGETERAELRRKLGDALANAGRGADAAGAYLDAAHHVPPDDALVLRRMAAEELLHSGHVDEGTEVIREVLSAAGLKPAPASPRAVLASVVWRRARIALRGLRFKTKDAAEIPPAELRALDACWSAANGYGMVDFLRGAEFQTRYLLLALRTGERIRVARALASEAAFRSTEGSPRAARLAARAVERAKQLVREDDDPLTLGWVHGTSALTAYMAGRWREALEACEHTHSLVFQRLLGTWWELAVMELYQAWALFQLGDVAELLRRPPALLARALEKGDRYSATNLSNGFPNFTWLLRDEPHEARRVAVDTMSHWPTHSVHLQHYWHTLALSHVDLYEGDPASGVARLREAGTQFERSLLMRMNMIRSETAALRARCLIAAARANGDASLLRDAEHDVRSVARSRIIGFDSLAAMLAGCIAGARGDTGAAVRNLERAIAGLDAAEMALWAAAARRRLGLARADDALIREADDWMKRRGVVNPERVAAVLAP